MKSAIALIAAFFLMLLFSAGYSADLRPERLTQAEIDKLREQRHEFYRAEAAGMNESIRAELLAESDKVDGNQNDYDVHYYVVDLRLDFTAESIAGHVEYEIESKVAALGSVDLNLVDQMSVSGVTVEGQPATFSHINNLLSITLPASYSEGQRFGMIVYYSGQPSYAGSSGMEFAPIDGYPVCWTHCSPYAARHWWPCKDYPVDKADSVDLWFEYPDAYTCVSNGVQLTDVDLGDGYRRTHYSHRYPITTYLVAVACAQYDEHLQTWDYDTVSMPVYSYALPSAPDEFTAFQEVTPDVLTRLSDRWGLYPFSREKMGSASYGWGGAMEHQTCAFYNTTFFDDWVIAHETGHQWFGDMLSACNFHHVWLKEGFASYGEAIYFESRDGQQAYFDHMQTQKFIGDGTVYVEDLLNDDIFDPNLTYDKASWVVHMLRGVVGDADFFEAVATYRAAHEYGCAVTEDLADAVSSVAGEDMTWFFNEWIYGAGNPEYQYQWLCEPSQSKAGYTLHLFVEQVQTYGTYFRMPIQMVFATTGGPVDTTLWCQGAEQYHLLELQDSVTAIQFDPHEWVLRTAEEVPFTLHLIPRQLPAGHLNYAYRAELRGLGGVPPYTWSKSGGDLPLGLFFYPDSALIKGTPSWPANYYFSLKVTDSDSPPHSEIHSFTLAILAEPPVICGDADGDQIVNITDAVYIISYVFNSGPEPQPYEAGDVNEDGIVNITDAVYLIQWIFNSGPAPCSDSP
ncbi:MAG: M1 family aminopeptidase [bacterium]